MKKEEALQIIKALIDVASKRGLYENIESAVQVSNAFNLIATELTKENE
jgi:hypothetical protein